MSSTFFGLELSRRALASQQAALNITGHNISNANTEGYTRQVGNLTATTPYTINVAGKSVSYGTGVSLETVTRARDNFVDRQFRGETSKQQYWAGRQDSLQKIEGMLNEPSENSLHSDMDKFWNSWSDLAKNPESMGARSVVRERALTLTESFHNMAQQVSDMRASLDSNIKVQVYQINTYGQQIKELNDQIKRAEVAGDSPNDLRDKRDLLVDELSKVVSVRVIETKDPAFTDRNVSSFKVIIGNENSPENTLVNDSLVRFLENPPPQKVINGYNSSIVVWSDDTTLGKKELDLGNKVGSLAANIEVRDIDLPKFGEQFDILAQGIASAVNALHQTGQGLKAEGVAGINFFTDGSASPVLDSKGLPIITASTIKLNFEIENDLTRIATGTLPLDASTDPPTHTLDAHGNPLVTVGDGSIARALSSLAGGWSALKSLIASGKFGAVDKAPVVGASFGDFYGANVAQIGVNVQQANRMKAGQDVLVVHLSNQRESISGVSLDEEMTNLVRFQKSYSAAARMVTMMDDMLDTIVNRMGMTR